MSGPITPPLTVTTSGTGTPSGRPITTIKVSDGDLTISGNVATIDTSGSGGVPGGSTTEVQYNNAGAFAGDAGFFIATAGGGSSTKIRVGDIFVGSNVNALVQAVQDGNLRISPEGSGQLTLTSNGDAGGTMTDMQVNITAQSATDDPILKLGNLSSPSGEMRLDGATGDVLISALGTNNDLDLKINGTGQVEVINTTTNNDTTFSVKGNGTGDAIINLNNPTKSVQLTCDTNQQLKVEGGLNSFIFDASSATGGIQWPDGTIQTTASSGGGGGGGGNFPMPQGATNSTYKYLNIGTAAPYGTNAGAIAAHEGDYLLNTRPRYFPFIAPASATPSSMYVMQATVGSGTATAGIYTSNSDNYPDTLVATGTYDPTTTGNKTITNTESTALVGGELYFYCVRSSSPGGNINAIKKGYIPSIFPSWRIHEDDENTCLTGNNFTTGTTLPSTAVWNSGAPGDIDRPQFWLEF